VKLQKLSIIGVIVFSIVFVSGLATVGESSNAAASTPPAGYETASLTKISGLSPFTGCDISGQTGTNFLDTES